MPVARDELLFVHLKARAVSISLCEDAKAQLSEIRVGVNIKSLAGYGDCSGAVTLFWALPELETLSGRCLYLYLPLHIQNSGACSFTWPCSAWQPWLCIVDDSDIILCIPVLCEGFDSLFVTAAWTVGWLQAGQQRQELASRLTGTLCDKLFCRFLHEKSEKSQFSAWW